MVTRSNAPHSRLTHLSVEMAEPLEREENSDVKAILFLNDKQMGGIQVHGYGDDTTAAMVDLLVHLGAMFRSQGKRLMLMGDDGFTIMDSEKDAEGDR